LHLFVKENPIPSWLYKNKHFFTFCLQLFNSYVIAGCYAGGEHMKKRLIISAFVSLIAVTHLAAGWRHARRQEVNALPAAGGSTTVMTPLGKIPYYLQNDPAWGEETIGGSSERMAAAGCTVTCLAMGLTALGYAIDPFQACAGLKRHGGFTANGYVVWAGVTALTDGKVEVRVAPLRRDIIDAELAEKCPVIVKIMLTETIAHWILLVGKEGEDYLAMDPLNQEHTLVTLSANDIDAIRVFRFYSSQ